MNEREELLADEILIVRNSGEIPEIAFHSTIFFLTSDPEGPQIALKQEEITLLRRQVIERYREILIRDLTPDNRDKSIFRGVKRSIFNWERLGKFCQREELPVENSLRQEIAEALHVFLHQEALEVREGVRVSCLNCTETELLDFAATLGLEPNELPVNWQSICPLEGC